jgi:hypothetical protein
LAELDTPAEDIYINPKTHVYMSPNQAQPAQNVKIRWVRNATRGLLTVGVAAAVLVLVLLLAVAQPAAGADTGETYQYARSHVTLYG